jgi:hypothetical protein
VLRGIVPASWRMYGLTPLMRSGTRLMARSLIGAVLLLLQLTPVFGAAMCMHNAARSVVACSMPMDGAAQENDRSHSGPAQDCARMVVCAPAAPAVPQVAVQLIGIMQPSRTGYSTPASLSPGDSAAPLQPPPIV